MEGQLLSVLTVTSLREDSHAFLVLLYDLNRFVNPRQVGVLTVDGDATGVTQEEPEATLLETVFGGQIVYPVLAENGSHYRPVQMAGVIDDEQRRTVELTSAFRRLNVINLGPEQRFNEEGRQAFHYVRRYLHAFDCI